MTARLLVWWDGHVPGSSRRFRLSFRNGLPEGGPLHDEDARRAWDHAIEDARRPIALEPAPADTPVARAIEGTDPVRATWRELLEHRRAVAGRHWRVLLDLVHALENTRAAPERGPDLVAVRVTALAELAPVAQHAGHLRHALSLANDVSLRAAALTSPRHTTLMATRPLLLLPRDARRALGVDKRRRAVALDARGWWRGAPPPRAVASVPVGAAGPATGDEP